MFPDIFGKLLGSSVQTLNIQFEKKNYKLHFEREDYVNGKILLGVLRQKLAELFKVPRDSVEVYLMEPLKKLGGDQKFLSDFGVRNNSWLKLVVKNARATSPSAAPTGKKDKPSASAKHTAPAPAAKSSEKTFPNTAEGKCEEAIYNVKVKLGDKIKEFCDHPPTTEKAREKDFLMLNEVILQNILKLDSVETDGNPDLRQLRKTTINTLQDYHNKIDEANKKSLAIIAKSGSEPSEEASREASPGVKPKSPNKNKGKKKKSKARR